MSRIGKALLLGFFSATAVAARGEDEPKKPRVRVGPNVLVSRDGDVPHVELMVAAHPRNAKTLVGTAITFTRPDGGCACKTYASTDGGVTWTDAQLPEQMEFGGADPQVGFGLHGTALFAGLSFVKDEKGRTRAGLHVHRSVDGGHTWLEPADLGYSYDHEQLVVDRTTGRYAGRVYLGVLHGRYPQYVVSVFRSEDDGRTFVGPVQAAVRDNQGINVTNLLVLSVGTLFVPFSQFEIDAEKRKAAKTSPFLFVTSEDGGVTYSKETRIGEQFHGGGEAYEKRAERNSIVGNTFPVYAVDARGSKFKDRLYVAWNDFATGPSRMLFAWSGDRGKSWSAPRPIDASAPATASQYQPAIAVDADGVVGVTWFDTRASADEDRYDLWFSASIDGGVSFLPAARVSSESSFPRGAGNVRPVPIHVESGPEKIGVSFLSAFSRWEAGGDYMGLTTDAAGAFRPFWADSRTGTFQVWTARVLVEQPAPPEAKKETAPKAGAKSPDPDPDPDPEADDESPPPATAGAERTAAKLSDRIALVFDPVRHDAASREAIVPVRLKNVSRERLFGPLRVEVKSVGDAAKPVQILNAANGKSGEGATFDYAAALRDLDALEPGEVTEAVAWKVRLPGTADTAFSLEVVVTGFLAPAK